LLQQGKEKVGKSREMIFMQWRSFRWSLV